MRSTIVAIAVLMAVALPVSVLAAPVEAAGPTGPEFRTIEVEATGEAKGVPDVAYLSLQIETHAPSAEEAARRNAALSQKVMTELKSKLGDKGQVETGGYALTPEYDERLHREKPMIVGYNAQNSITVETAPSSVLGSLIDAAIAAGANRINYLNFGLKDDTKARSQAITMAAHDAQAQAQALAAALGVKIKRVVKASTIVQRPGPVMYRMAAAAPMAAQATPVEPGEVTVSANVSMIYEIE